MWRLQESGFCLFKAGTADESLGGQPAGFPPRPHGVSCGIEEIYLHGVKPHICVTGPCRVLSSFPDLVGALWSNGFAYCLVMTTAIVGLKLDMWAKHW